MMPTIADGDRIFVDKNVDELKRGDIVLFYFPKDKSKTFIKRIIGLPNETLDMRNGQVFVDDKPLDEQYIKENFNQIKPNLKPIKISSGEYYVLGDNRDNSYDSRSWGTLPKNLIFGKYYATYLHGK